MIDDVRIETISGASYLVIDFNTASGKEDIQIPLTDIFDPSNYYNKTEVDNAISAATSGKADTSAVTAVNNVLTAHTADTTIHVTSADKTAWNAKSDFSGSYNDLTDKPTIPSVSSAITSGDTNAVAGGAVYDKFDEVEQVTARALIDLNDKFGGLKLQKLTQAQYDALSGSTDSNTLYVIVN